MKNIDLDVIGLLVGVLIGTIAFLFILIAVVYMSLKAVTIIYL